MNKVIEGFGYITVVVVGLIFIALCMLYGAWAGAFVGVHLWAWFVVPIFGIAKLTMSQAFGLSLLVAFWTRHFHVGHKDERKIYEKVIELISLLVSPWITLLIGYLCHHFFM